MQSTSWSSANVVVHHHSFLSCRRSEWQVKGFSVCRRRSIPVELVPVMGCIRILETKPRTLTSLPPPLHVLVLCLRPQMPNLPQTGSAQQRRRSSPGAHVPNRTRPLYARQPRRSSPSPLMPKLARRGYTRQPRRSSPRLVFSPQPSVQLFVLAVAPPWSGIVQRWGQARGSRARS